MPEALVDRFRAGFELFNRTGEIADDVFAPDVEMRQASSIIDTAGTFRGREGLAAALGELTESFEELTFEPEEVRETPAGDLLAFVRVRGRGKGSGLILDNEIAWLAKVRDAQVIRIAVYEERADALEAAGLA